MLRGFYGHFFQPAPVQTVSASVLNYTSQLPAGENAFTALPSERDEEHHSEKVAEWQETLTRLGSYGTFGDSEASDEGGQRERDAEVTRPDACQQQAAGDGHEQEQIVLRLQPPQEPGQQESRHCSQHDEGDDTSDRDETRSTPDPEHDDKHQGRADPDQVLDHAPPEQLLVSNAVGRAAPAPGDVDDDDARRHGDREADQCGARGRHAEGDAGRGAQDPCDRDLERRQ